MVEPRGCDREIPDHPVAGPAVGAGGEVPFGQRRGGKGGARRQSNGENNHEQGDQRQSAAGAFADIRRFIGR